jgi:hypothetical protein
VTPLSPTTVAYLSGKESINVCALANLAASRTSSAEASGLPYRIFSKTVPANKTGS